MVSKKVAIQFSLFGIFKKAPFRVNAKIFLKLCIQSIFRYIGNVFVWIRVHIIVGHGTVVNKNILN